MIFSALSQEVAHRLGYYVYVLRDPRDGQVFYVGKGVGSRLFAHVHESEGIGDYAKLARIREVHAAGLSVERLVVRHGLDEESATFLVEQSVIDALTATGVRLTNRVKGHAASEFGLSTIEAMVTKYEAPPLPPLTEPAGRTTR